MGIITPQFSQALLAQFLGVAMQSQEKITLSTLKSKKNITPNVGKNPSKITAITAYDALFSRIFDGIVDVILVGDSLNMSFNGKEDTTSLTLNQIIYHTKAVLKHTKYSFVIADMPFGSYECEKSALKNALKIIKQTGVQALKLEVPLHKLNIIKALINEGIPVMAHIGLMPQFVKFDGGYKIKGKDSTQSAYLLESALAFEEAGVFGLLLEGIISSVAKDISSKVKIPTIGIGSGVDCDGQILVWSDAFGLFSEFKPKFVRTYLNGAEIFKQALQQYVKDIKNGDFPNEKESY